MRQRGQSSRRQISCGCPSGAEVARCAASLPSCQYRLAPSIWSVETRPTELLFSPTSLPSRARRARWWDEARTQQAREEAPAALQAQVPAAQSAHAQTGAGGRGEAWRSEVVGTHAAILFALAPRHEWRVENARHV